jgi:Mrp family chromosome partitioning ATPase
LPFIPLEGIRPMRSSVRKIADSRREESALGRIVSMLVLRERPQAVAFIAARSGEGTTTTAREFVRLLSQHGYKVLLVKSAVPAPSGQLTPVVQSSDVLSSRKQLESVVHREEDPPYHELWLDSRSNPGLGARVAMNGEFWTGLKGIYDYVVIDSPALEQTYEGSVLAARADNVVLLVESEATPIEAVSDLRATLEQMGAKILGVLMTKHRSYLPAMR